MCRRDGNSGALGTRNVAKVDIDSDGFVGAMDFLLCRGDGAEQEIGDVGQHGGSTSGDEVGSEAKAGPTSLRGSGQAESGPYNGLIGISR